MAVVADQVIVELEAKLAKYMTEVERARVAFERNMLLMQRAAERTEAANDRLGRSYGRFGRQGAAGLIVYAILRRLDDGATEAAGKVRELENAFISLFDTIVHGIQTGISQLYDYVIKPLYDLLIKIDTLARTYLSNPASDLLGLPRVTPLQEQIPLPSDQSNIAAKRGFNDFPFTPELGKGSPGRARAKKYPKIFDEDASDRVIASLQLEKENLSRTAEEQRVYNELSAASVDIKSAEGQVIVGLVHSIEQEKLARELANQQWEDFRSVSEDVFGSIVDDIKAGKSAMDILIDATKHLEDQLLRLGQQKLFDILFGTAAAGGIGTPGGGGVLGALVGGLFGAPRAQGGDVMPGRIYPVGEGGKREYFVPKMPGTIVPANRGMGVTFAPSTVIDARGADAGVEQRLRGLVEQENRKTIRVIQRSLPAMLAESQLRN